MRKKQSTLNWLLTGIKKTFTDAPRTFVDLSDEQMLKYLEHAYESYCKRDIMDSTVCSSFISFFALVYGRNCYVHLYRFAKANLSEDHRYYTTPKVWEGFWENKKREIKKEWESIALELVEMMRKQVAKSKNR